MKHKNTFDKYTFYFLLILLVGFIIRVYNLNPPLLERAPNRQMIAADIVRDLYRYGFKNFNSFLYGLPIYHWLTIFLYSLFGGINEIWGKLISIFASVASALLFFKLIRLYFNKKQSVVSTFFFYLLSPVHIIISRSFMIDELTLTFALAGFYFLALWQKRKIKFSFIIGSIFFSLMLLSKITFAYLLLPALFIVISRKNTRIARNITYVFLFGLISLLAPTLWYSYAGKLNYALDQYTGWDISVWFSIQLLLDKQFYSNVFFHYVKYAITPIGLIFSLWGLLIKSEYKKYFLFYLWFLSAIIFVIAFNNGTLNHSYYFLIFSAPCAVFASRAVMCLESLLIKQKYFLPNYILIPLFSLLSLSAVVNDNFVSAYKTPYKKHELVPLTIKIAQNYIPRKAKVIGTAYTSTVLNYFIDRDFTELRIAPMNDKQVLKEFKKLKAKGADYYLLYDTKELAGKKEFVGYLDQYQVIFSDPSLSLVIYRL